jgi:hypothetical protein
MSVDQRQSHDRNERNVSDERLLSAKIGSRQRRRRRRVPIWGRLPIDYEESSRDDKSGGRRGDATAMRCAGLDSMGRVAFGRDSCVKEEALYAVFQRDKANPDEIVELLSKTWALKPPHAVFSITGGAQVNLSQSGMAMNASLASDADAGLENFVMRNICQGLAAAAKATDAWIFSGGMDTGIMSAAGAALSSAGTPCIGVAVLQKVPSTPLPPLGPGAASLAWGCVYLALLASHALCAAALGRTWSPALGRALSVVLSCSRHCLWD